MSNDSHATTPLSHSAQQAKTCEVIQALIDSPKLNRYYHLDTMPERAALSIQWEENTPSDLPNCPHLTKWAQPITIERQPMTPYPLTITKLVLSEDIATVDYHYHAEGIHGTANFQRSAEQWQESLHRIVER